MANWWIMLDDRMLLHPPQVFHLWFQQKRIEAISQSMTVCVVWCGILIQWLLPLTCMTLYTYVSACSSNIIYNERHARWRTTHGKEVELGNENMAANWTRMCMSPPGVWPANPLAAEPYGHCQHLSIHSPLKYYSIYCWVVGVLYPENHLKLAHASTDKHQICST